MYRDRKDDNFKKNKRDFGKRDFDRRDFDDRDDFKKDNDNQPDKDIIFGRNSVSEAIKAERPLDSILVARGEHTGSIPKILKDAKTADIPVKEVDRKKLTLKRKCCKPEIQTEITALVENTVANKQLAEEEAASIAETVLASKNLISQSIGRVIPVVELVKLFQRKFAK